jgi:hypothetical protein
VDATELLENESRAGSLQDRDALYNSMFHSLPQLSLSGPGSGRGMFTGGGSARYIYPGPETSIEFANGKVSVHL